MGKLHLDKEKKGGINMAIRRTFVVVLALVFGGGPMPGVADAKKVFPKQNICASGYRKQQNNITVTIPARLIGFDSCEAFLSFTYSIMNAEAVIKNENGIGNAE